MVPQALAVSLCRNILRESSRSVFNYWTGTLLRARFVSSRRRPGDSDAMSSRKASHAGSWYESQGNVLGKQLSDWLDAASPTESPARAIIAPHAGYSYSGPCAGHAYRQIDPAKIKRVFILGPSHHVHLSNCAVPGVQVYETPIYHLPIDLAVVSELQSTGHFGVMDLNTDEDEHSIEMHLPYIAQVMASRKGNFKIVPILVGGLTPEKEQLFGQLLSHYLADPENLFVVSSDFCHWGKRFQYTYHEKSHGAIHQSTEALDRMGMEIIEKLQHMEFTQYLKKYRNTICGRHAIGVLLSTVQDWQKKDPSVKLSMRFVQYAQSNRVTRDSDSSVSYASASLVVR